MAEEPKTTTTTATDDVKRPGLIRRYYPSSSLSTSSHLLSLLLTLALLAGITALVLYLIYRPSHPRFSLTSASIYNLSTTPTSSYASTTVTSRMQFTLVARNPSDRTSILYDHLTAYAAYRGQPIAGPSELPPLVQERDSAVGMSVVVEGDDVPATEEVAVGLGVDKEYGVVGLRVVVVGRVKYKSGPFRSGWRGLYVSCDVVVGMRKGVAGRVPLIGEPQCKVDG